MSKEHIRLVYDGPALQDHTMDVRDLAPALLALGDLCEEANKLLNGNRATIKVLVHSEFEQGCFQITFDILQTIYHNLQGFLEDGKITNTEAILAVLGIITYPLGVGIGLLQYLKWRKGRPVTSNTEVRGSDGRVMIQVNCKGKDNSIVVSPQVYSLSERPRVLAAVKEIVRPLRHEGVQVATFKRDGIEQEHFDKEAANAIENTVASDELGEIEPQRVTARLRVHTLSFDPSSPKWKFWYGGEAITADVSRTSIAEDAVRRGRVSIDDTYKVEMEIKERQTKRGYVNDYTILKVLDFEPGKHQEEMVLSNWDLEDHTDLEDNADQEDEQPITE